MTTTFFQTILIGGGDDDGDGIGDDVGGESKVEWVVECGGGEDEEEDIEEIVISVFEEAEALRRKGSFELIIEK